MNHKSNRRAEKTESSLQDALSELLEYKDLDEITVTEIASKVNINRGTFYTHYNDIYDLFFSIEDKYTAEADNLFSAFLESKPLDFKDFSVKLYNHLISKPHILKSVLSSKHSRLTEKFAELGLPRDFDVWKSRFNIGNKDNYLYYCTSLISALNNLIYTWFENDFDISPEELAEIAQEIFYGFNPIIADDSNKPG